MRLWHCHHSACICLQDCWGGLCCASQRTILLLAWTAAVRPLTLLREDSFRLVPHCLCVLLQSHFRVYGQTKT